MHLANKFSGSSPRGWGRSNFAVVALAISAGSSLLAGIAHANELEIVALASSDYIYHGTTETNGNPAVGFAIDWQVTQRGFFGVEAHQAEVDGQPQRHRSVMVYAGAGFELGTDWFATAVVTHREFPKAVKEWDFTEFRLQLDHQSGWGATFDYSPDYYEHKTEAYTAEVRYQRELNESLYLHGSIGAVELSARRFTDYRYGTIGLGYRLGNAVLDLSYLVNSEGDSADFGRAAYSDSGVIAQLSWRIR